MKPLRSRAGLLALALAALLPAVVYAWPAAPRLVLPYERTAWHLAFSKDNTRLAVLDRPAGLDVPSRVLVWDVATGTLLHRLESPPRPYPSRVAFAPDGGSLGVVDAGRVIRWDLATGRVQAEYDHPGWSHDPDRHLGRELLFDASGRWLFHDLYEGRVYDVATGAVVRDYAGRWPDRSYHAAGGCVAARLAGTVCTFDAITGAEVGRFPTAVPRVPLARGGFFPAAGGIGGVGFSADERWVVYDAVTGRECPWGRATDEMFGFDLSPDRRFLAVAALEPGDGITSVVSSWIAGGGGRLRVYDTTSGAEVFGPVRHGHQPCFAPDGTLLAIAVNAPREVQVWDWPPAPRWPWALAAATPAIVLTPVLARRRRAGTPPPAPADP